MMELRKVRLNIHFISDDHGHPTYVAVIVVLHYWTVTVSPAETWELNVVLPLYTAVMVCAPRVRAAVLKTAFPPLRVIVPSVVEPFLKVTVPDGVPVPAMLAARVEVNVTV